MKKKLLLLGLIGLFGTIIVTGQTPARQQQINQQKRIYCGVYNSSLTQGEFLRLQQQQRAINQGKCLAARDGRVTRWERARIHQSQNSANRNIFRKKHNSWYRN